MRHVLFLIVFTLLPLSADAQNRSGKGEIRELWESSCAGCHGSGMTGGMAPSLLDDEWTNGGSDEEIAASIRAGIPGSGMPAFGETLNDEQVRALVILVREVRMQSGLQSLRTSLGGDVVSAAGHSYRLEERARTDGILWSIAFLPEDGLLVTQRDGKLWHVENGGKTRIENTPEVWQHGQGGLLEVAVHPGYANNGWVYLSFSEHKGGRDTFREAGMTTVVRGKIVDGKWTGQETLFSVDKDQHSAARVHFGSRFVFRDDYLFFAIGDRGQQDRAQDLGRPNGKIFRIHDDGRVPVDNPFVDTPGALPEIWSYGHRNPQGMDLDPATGQVWEAEHGPRGGDEINRIEKGKNYGWPVITYGMNYDGTPITHETVREGMEQPKLHWTPSIAVAGIDFYEGDAFPKWTGKLLAGGLASQELHLLTIEDDRVTSDEIIMKDRGRIRDVASAPDGTIYLLLNSRSPDTGRIVRMVPADP